jgi:hypothetical protein
VKRDRGDNEVMQGGWMQERWGGGELQEEEEDEGRRRTRRRTRSGMVNLTEDASGLVMML